jgi:hypothetical protein
MDPHDQLSHLLRTTGEVRPPAGYEEAFLSRLDRRIRAEARKPETGWLAVLEAWFRRPAVAWGAGLAMAAFAAGFFLRPDRTESVAVDPVPGSPLVPRDATAVTVPVGFEAGRAPAAVPVSGNGPAGVSPDEIPGKRRTVEQADGIPAGVR